MEKPIFKKITEEERRMTKFHQLFKYQEIMDDLAQSTRKDGWSPRQKTITDVCYALQDEICELTRELPSFMNFKVWKRHQYDQNKEFLEFIDILFFTFTLVNYIGEADYLDTEFRIKELFCANKFRDTISGKEKAISDDLDVRTLIDLVRCHVSEISIIAQVQSNKEKAKAEDILIPEYKLMRSISIETRLTKIFELLGEIGNKLGYTLEQVVDGYIDKYNQNIERIEKDWA